jgi:hypothetical protein
MSFDDHVQRSRDSEEQKRLRAQAEWEKQQQLREQQKSAAERVIQAQYDRANEILRADPRYHAIVTAAQTPELHDAMGYIWSQLWKRTKSVSGYKTVRSGLFGTKQEYYSGIVPWEFDYSKALQLPKVREQEMLQRSRRVIKPIYERELVHHPGQSILIKPMIPMRRRLK